LGEITQLGLSDHFLQGSTISNLKNLEILIFTENNLVGAIPEEITLMMNLRKIDFSKMSFLLLFQQPWKICQD